MNKELIDALDRLDALFSDESKWAKGWFAKDATGKRVRIFASDAASWCLLGAIDKADCPHEAIVDEFETALCRWGQLSCWNDEPNRTFADIKKLIADTRNRLKETT